MIDLSSKQLCKNLIATRHHHPAWQLLGAQRAPLLIGCLKPLFDSNLDGIPLEDAEQRLAEMLGEYANNGEFQVSDDDVGALARKELRDWIKRQLVVEREGKLIATDALHQALRFIDGLQERFMTSTASRLATVQREIENLETLLNPDPRARAEHLQRKIAALQVELSQIEAGHMQVLEGPKAVEGIREVFNLSMSLRADFRRVEDSYREADRRLRQSIVSEQHHRGEIVDKLLDSHDTLLETAEGQVFHGFHEQLNRSVELDNMKLRLRSLLKNDATKVALTHHQQSDLRWLVASLVRESRTVIQARARSERDVKGFLKTGLAAEHHRVGELLNELFEVAIDMHWQRQSLRRTASTLPPVAVAIGTLPLIERLRFKTSEDNAEDPLDLDEKRANLEDIDEDFWAAFDTLDRAALIEDTVNLLKETTNPMTIADISKRLPPTHDLETFALWLSMAREVDLPLKSTSETIDIIDKTGKSLRFHIPEVELTAAAFENISRDL